MDENKNLEIAFPFRPRILGDLDESVSGWREENGRFFVRASATMRILPVLQDVLEAEGGILRDVIVRGMFQTITVNGKKMVFFAIGFWHNPRPPRLSRRRQGEEEWDEGGDNGHKNFRF